MSLKHCLEATKSPLQGPLMDYLLSLVKHHKSEVDQALQNDPTLKAEVDYDLRQYERAKKEAQKREFHLCIFVWCINSLSLTILQKKTSV